MSNASKQRLDKILVERGLAESREKAKGLIMSGLVFVAGQKVDKAGALVLLTDDIDIKSDPNPFVSRGGIKLKKALDLFQPPIKGKIYMDVGASTGGFTDCLLQYGAQKVYSIDVGYGQLAWNLRQDKRVSVMERTNIRNVTPDDFSILPQGAVIDVAFISLKIVLPVIKGLLSPDSHIIALIKPQFEAGLFNVDKKGVVRSPEIHIEVLEGLVSVCQEINLTIEDFTYSPIKGPKGNIEYFIHLYYGENIVDNYHDHWDYTEKIQSTVREAYEKLNL